MDRADPAKRLLLFTRSQDGSLQDGQIYFSGICGSVDVDSVPAVQARQTADTAAVSIYGCGGPVEYYSGERLETVYLGLFI